MKIMKNTLLIQQQQKTTTAPTIGNEASDTNSTPEPRAGNDESETPSPQEPTVISLSGTESETPAISSVGITERKNIEDIERPFRVRRSESVKKQIMKIDAEDIGEDDDPNDPNYE